MRVGGLDGEGMTPSPEPPGLGSAPRTARALRRDVISVRSIDELIAYLPYSLGHRPHEDLVIVGMRGKELLVTARLALWPDDGPDDDSLLAEADADVEEIERTPFTPRAARTLARSAFETLARNGVTAVHLVAFEARRGESDVVVEAAVQAVSDFGLELFHLHVVRDGRRWSPLAPDVRERVDGIPLTDQSDSPAVLAGMVSGRAPLPNRRAVAQLVAEDPALSEHVGAAMDDGGVRRGFAARLWRRVLTAPESRGSSVAGRGPLLGAPEIARLLVSLGDVHWRDGLIAWAAPGSLPMDALPERVQRALRTHLPPTPEDTHAVLERLRALARQAPASHPELVAPICTVVGCVAWHQGEGSTARDAHERALAAVPTYRLAQLGLHVVAHGLRGDVPGPGHALGLRGRRAV